MNRDTLQGQWLQLRGQVREKWGKLTDNDMARIGGSVERLLGKLQERYGYAREKAEKEFDAWLSSCEVGSDKHRKASV